MTEGIIVSQGSERTQDVVERLRYHVQIRGGPARDEDGKPVAPNGAWTMMLEAADTIASLREEVERERERADKFMWQVRDTCARAEAAESRVSVLNDALSDIEAVAVSVAVAAPKNYYRMLSSIATRARAARSLPVNEEKVPVARPVAFRVPRADAKTAGATLSPDDFRLFTDEEDARVAAGAIGSDYDGLYLVADRRAAFFAQPKPVNAGNTSSDGSGKLMPAAERPSVARQLDQAGVAPCPSDDFRERAARLVRGWDHDQRYRTWPEFGSGVFDKDGVVARFADCMAASIRALPALSPSPARVADREALFDLVIKFDECETAEPTLRQMIFGYYCMGLHDADKAKQYTERFVLSLLDNGGGTRTQGSEG